MTVLVDLADSAENERGVDLCGLDAGVTEHLLKRTKVGAVSDQVGREGMSEHMRRYPLLDSGILGTLVEGTPNPMVGQPPSTAAQEEERGVGMALGKEWTGMSQVSVYDIDGTITDGDEAVLSSSGLGRKGYARG